MSSKRCTLKPSIVRDPPRFILHGHMSSNYEPLVPASPDHHSDGLDVDRQYGDKLRPAAQALDRARQGFLHGNGLPQRWRDKDVFTVCETRFGAGLNFIALWLAWRNDPRRSKRLHMMSFEAHPFKSVDLARQLAPLPPQEALLAGQLIASWPPLLPGIHRLEFEEDAVTLTLAFGSLDRMAKQVSACADAFFLEGMDVSPMAMSSLMGQLVRMASTQATLASWSCAPMVRQALSDAGFLVSQAQTRDAQKEITTATLRAGMGSAKPRRLLSESIAIVGGGIAAAGIAHALAVRGHKITVLDPRFIAGPAASHRGHLAAALTPVLSRDYDIRSRLSQAGVQGSLQQWQNLGAPAQPWRCGSFQPVSQEETALWQAALARLQLPEDYVRWLDAAQASERTGMALGSGGLWFGQGQRVRPNLLLPRLFSHRRIYCRPAAAANLRRLSDGRWAVLDHHGHEVALASQVVLANAADTANLLAQSGWLAGLPKLAAMYRLAGQISYFRNQHALHSCAVLAGKGYWLPVTQQVHVGGSTYRANTATSTITTQGHQEIIGKLAALLDVMPSRFSPLPASEDGWAGWRAAVADRLPVIGRVPKAPGLWLACAFGSRGMTWSPLAADIIGTQLHHEPVPLERELLRRIAPR